MGTGVEEAANPSCHPPPAFIVANPPSDFPEYKNYLLASARYGHGLGELALPRATPSMAAILMLEPLSQQEQLELLKFLMSN